MSDRSIDGTPVRIAAGTLDFGLRLVGAFAFAALAGLALIGSADVVGGAILGRGLPSAREVSEVLLALLVFAGIGLAFRDDGHIRVDLFISSAGPRFTRASRSLSALLAALVFAVMAWGATHAAARSWEIGERAAALIRFPLWPVKWIIALLMWMIVIECLRLALRPTTPLHRSEEHI